MKKTIKMVLAMTVLGMISAALLTGVYAWTNPIIEANLRQIFFEKIEEYLPEAKDTENITEEDQYPEIHVVYGPDDELIGFMIENTAGGYEGDILYFAIADEEGYIKGVEVIEHTETPGIGAEIEREEFRQQFVGKHYTDSFAAGDEIDIISGATVSSQAMIASLRNTMQELGQTAYLEEEEVPEIELADLPDGTFVGSAPGLNDEVVVEVTIEDGRIVAIEILDHDDTPDYFEQAKNELVDVIKEEQSVKIDTVSGATSSSRGIIDAVMNALLNGLEDA